MNPRVLLVAVVLVGLGAGALAGSLIVDDDRSAFTSGSGHAFVETVRTEGYDAERIVAGPTELRTDTRLDPARTMLFVPGSESPYSSGDAQFTRSFLEEGGTVVVADDFGKTNSLISDLGIVFERVRLVEPSQQVTIQLEGETYDLQDIRLTALHVRERSQAKVLAESSPDSFLDRDGDGVVDSDDPHGPFPLAVEVSVGEGRLMAFASPGFFEEPASPSDQREAWWSALVRTSLSDEGRVVVEESRLATDDPVMPAIGAVVAPATASTWRLALAASAMLVLGMVLFPFATEAWEPHRFRPDRFISRRVLGEGPEEDDGAGGNGAPFEEDDGSAWTSRGVAALVGTVFLAVGGLVVGNVQATQAAAVMLVLSIWALLSGRPRVEAERTVSTTRTREGTEIVSTLRFESKHNRPLPLEVREGVPPEFELVDGHAWFEAWFPRGESTIQHRIQPAVRGPYDLGPLEVRRKDLLGLRSHRMKLADADRIEVAPRAESVRRLPFDTKLPTIILGPHAVNRPGDGSEFHSLREYQEGDSFRNVNWKASARNAQENDLFVNEREHMSRATLYLLLDARRISGAGPAMDTPLNRGARAVLSLFEAASKVRDRVHLIIYGDGIHEISPGPRSRQLRKLEDLLATVPARGETGLREVVEEIGPEIRTGDPVFVVSGLEDDPGAIEALREVRMRGGRPGILGMPLKTKSEASPVSEPEPEAEKIKADQMDTLSQLRSAGVDVFEYQENLTLDGLFLVGGTP